MTARLSALALVLAAALVAASGCGSSTAVSSTWMDERHASRQLGATLVVGVARIQENGVLFEERFAAQLDQREVRAVTANSLIGAETEVTREVLEAAIEGLDLRSVLVARVIDIETRRAYTPPTHAAQHGANAALFDLTARSYSAAGVPGTYSEQTVVVIESSVYDIATEELVWTAETESIDPDAVEEAIDELIAVLLGELTRSGQL